MSGFKRVDFEIKEGRKRLPYQVPVDDLEFPEGFLEEVDIILQEAGLR